jgi:Acetoacetate decarboxylase (ADC)
MSAGPSHKKTPSAEHDLSSGSPSGIPSAPWRSSVDALLWLHPAARTARTLLPPQLAARAGMPVTIGGLISYRDGPVGPYAEIFGAPVMLRGALMVSHIPFMAVDSAASVAGGRGNWALPKELADFDGDPGRPGPVTARGEGWELRITTTARRRQLPMTMTMRAAQVWADGQVRSFSVRMRGRARLARVEVEHVTASPLGDWLVGGRHLAMLVSGRQDVSPASP